MVTIGGETHNPAELTETISFNDLSDVTITAVADNDLIQFNSASGEWENITVAALSAQIAITDLSDVDTTGVSTGDFIQKSAGDWVDFNLFGTANTWTADQTFSTDTKLIFRNTGTFISSPAVSEFRFTSEEGLGPIITWFAGSVEGMRLTTGGIVFNETANSALDFRGETVNDTNAFLIDSGGDIVSTGTSVAFDIKGEADGQVVAFMYNQQSAGSADQNLRWGVTTSTINAGDGIIMPKAGSIISHSVAMNITTATSGDVTFEIQIEGTNVSALEQEFLSSGGTGLKSGFTNASRNTTGATFTAGQSLNPRANETGTMAWDDVFGVILVQFDT